MELLKDKKVLLVIAPDNFRDEEYMEPKKILEENGAKVITVSKGVGEAKGILGSVVKVDVRLQDLRVEDSDALVFIGGPGSAIYFNDGQVLTLVKKAADKNKIIGGICFGSIILANAGVLVGKKATTFPSKAENLKTKGVNYLEQPVVVDGKIVTAQGPQAAQEFGRQLVDVLVRN